MSRRNWKVSIAEQAVSSLTISKSPPPFFYLFEHFSYIHWFSSSSFREYSQMCKATSNSNISWSKKWNLHLTAFFNNVQSPFNRKMEQSANRKRKGLIKTHQRRSWRFPHSESSRGTAPSPMLRAELSAPIDAGHWSTKGRWFGLIWRALASTVHWLVFLSLKQSKADAGAPHNALLLHPPPAAGWFWRWFWWLTAQAVLSEHPTYSTAEDSPSHHTRQVWFLIVVSVFIIYITALL